MNRRRFLSALAGIPFLPEAIRAKVAPKAGSFETPLMQVCNDPVEHLRYSYVLKSGKVIAVRVR